MGKYELEEGLTFSKYFDKNLQKEFYMAFGGLMNIKEEISEEDDKVSFLSKFYFTDGFCCRTDELTINEIKFLMQYSFKTGEDELLKYCLKKKNY